MKITSARNRLHNVPWRRAALGIGVVLALVLTARYAWRDVPLTADEAGFLIIGGQWHPGPNLYGSYWVDRPPLLIGLFSAAAALGGTREVVHLMAALSATLVVITSGWIGWQLGSGRSQRPTGPALMGATVAAILTTSADLVGWTSSGELLALPFVTMSLGAIFTGLSSGSSQRWMYYLLAGALSGCAVMVKQNFLDAGFLVLGLVATLIIQHQGRHAAELAFATTCGAVLAVALIVVWAASHGTTPTGIWDAVITFRTQATALFTSAPPQATVGRARDLLWLALASGIILPLPLMISTAIGRVSIIGAWLLLLAWESFVVVGGGSYWPHYLLNLVPAVVIASAAAATGGRGRKTLLAVALVYSLSVSITSGWRLYVGPQSSNRAITKWGRAHVTSGDTAVVAFGEPQLLTRLGLTSPYPYLWSLSVRVRDPRLDDFAALLRSPRQPMWVFEHYSLGLWGRDTSAGTKALHTNYELIAKVRAWRVWRLKHQ